MSQTATNKLAGQLSRYPVGTVLEGCRAYLDQGCAAQGKSERYFLGIVRRIAQNTEGDQAAQTARSTLMTEGGRALERAIAEHRQEQKSELSE